MHGCELQFMEAGVKPSLVQEFLVRTRFPQLSMVKDQNPIYTLDC